MPKKTDGYLLYISVGDITDKHLLQQRNAALSKKLDAVVSNTSDGIIRFHADRCGANIAYEFINAPMCRILQYDRGELSETTVRKMRGCWR